MKVLTPGQRATIGDYSENYDPATRVVGQIASVTLYDESTVLYTVRWWDGRELLSHEFSDNELAFDEEPKWLEIRPTEE